MGLGVWESLALAELAVLLVLALGAALARRPVKVIREGDYTDGVPRTFVPVAIVTDGTPGGTYLADARSGRRLVFTGLGVAKQELRFAAGGRLGTVALVLERVAVERPKGG